MQHLPIWFLGNLPEILCDYANYDLEMLPPKDGSLGVEGAEIEHKIRDTTIRFADENYWLAGVMWEHAIKANKKCKWDYEIDSHEAVQYAHYGVEQHYTWHTDTFTLCGSPKDRKITVVCLMNDPAEFEGGEFQVRLYGEYVAPLTKGSLIAFPSILEHRVTPVTKGIRKSATIWLNGPRFR